MTQLAVGSKLLDKNSIRGVVAEMRALAIRALKRMYLPAEGLFAFRLRRTADGDVLEGVSGRYTATVLLALADEPETTWAEMLAGDDPITVCGRLIDRLGRTDDLGEVALTLWAARRLRHPNAAVVLKRLREFKPLESVWPTVELAWSLTSQSVDGGDGRDPQLADALARRLLTSFQTGSGLFPHWPAGAQPSRLREHVACYADFVYPIQALSHYHRASGDSVSLETARQCAQRMCELQGSEGQWWWHYDVRTGHVIERFPVYSVHQDSMGPMALFALEQADGTDYSAVVARGVHWMLEAPEIRGSLIDRNSDVIWRKVARCEPSKLARKLQAGASRLHPALRVPGLDMVLRPGRIDYESRPYHMGWILHAWPADRVERFLAE